MGVFRKLAGVWGETHSQKPRNLSHFVHAYNFSQEIALGELPVVFPNLFT
jgi:hypothetical protein